MTRRSFLVLAPPAAGSLLAWGSSPTRDNDLIMPFSPIKTKVGPMTLWGFSTGAVKVKRSHRGPGWGIPHILVDPTWTEWLPIWTWVVDHPEGLLIVDTGEIASIQTQESLDGTGPTGWVTNKILRFSIGADDELPTQMRRAGIDPAGAQWVVLTHLHLDHMDGLRAFPKAEVLVSRQEWANPYGAVMARWPTATVPRQVSFLSHALPGFPSSFPLTADKSILLLPTPGHTYGHMSVLLRADTHHVLLAGDVAFSQQQLLTGDIPGITADKRLLAGTHQAIKTLSGDTSLLFLPSHDPGNADRVAKQAFLTPLSRP